MNWKEYFKIIVETIALKSKDERKVGAIIVGPSNEIRSTGFNGLPKGCVDDPVRLKRPQKYIWIEHAERNAIFQAAYSGISTRDCTLYCSLFPCSECSRAIIQSGITKIITNEPDFNDPKWGELFRVSIDMMHDANVTIEYF